MTRFALGVILAAGMVTSVVAQDDAAVKKSPAKLFVIELTRMVVEDVESASSAGLHGAQLAAQIRTWDAADQIASVDTLSLTCVEQVESTAQFGRRVAMITGTTNLGSGRVTTNSSWEQVGTLVRARIVAVEDQIVVELSYESSTVEPADDEKTSFGEIATTTITTQLRLQPGQQQVITSSQGKQRTVLLCEVSEAGSSSAMRRNPRIAPPTPRRTRPQVAPPNRSQPGRPPTRRPPARPEARRTSESRTSGSALDRYRQFAAGLFKRYDTNEDGALDPSEAKNLRGGFAAYDVDQDGKITTEEFVAYHTRRIPQ